MSEFKKFIPGILITWLGVSYYMNLLDTVTTTTSLQKNIKF